MNVVLCLIFHVFQERKLFCEVSWGILRTINEGRPHKTGSRISCDVDDDTKAVTVKACLHFTSMIDLERHHQRVCHI